MKTFLSIVILPLLVLLSLLVFSPTTIAQDMQWTELTYHYQTGTVPPPYFYKYDITLNTAGDISLVYSPGYNTQPGDTWAYNLKALQQDVDSINNMLISSCIFDKTIEALPQEKTPIGGSLQNMIIVLKQEDPLLDQAPKRITTPYFPECEIVKETLKTIYEKIKSLVPEDTWNAINTKKEEYIKSKKE